MKIRRHSDTRVTETFKINLWHFISKPSDKSKFKSFGMKSKDDPVETYHT